jgi:predicted glycosyltransferase involved in capsule biosynthesis
MRHHHPKIRLQELKEELNLLKIKNFESLDNIQKIKNQKITFNQQNKEDITVIIAWRNIGINRLENCLRSIRNQNYNQNLINITLIDYGSSINNSEIIKNKCKKYKIKYIFYYSNIFCKPHALNIGIKNSNTKYILISDIDIVFEKNYIKECIKEIKKNYFQIIYSKMFDCFKNSIKSKENFIKDYYKIKKRCKDRAIGKNENIFRYGSSICFTLSHFFKSIQGYDEFYTGWGADDADIIKRFELIGLNIRDLTSKVSYIHQWHPKYEGYNSKEKEQIKKNRDYFMKTNTILRNSNGWGELTQT